VTAARQADGKYVSITERSKWQRHNPIIKLIHFHGSVERRTREMNDIFGRMAEEKVVRLDSISKIGKSFDTGQSMKRPRLDALNNKRRKETRISFTHLSKVSIAAKFVDRRFWQISQKRNDARLFRKRLQQSQMKFLVKSDDQWFRFPWQSTRQEANWIYSSRHGRKSFIANWRPGQQPPPRRGEKLQLQITGLLTVGCHSNY
jgi:hypothetical protein